MDVSMPESMSHAKGSVYESAQPVMPQEDMLVVARLMETMK
jgi:hypothetical protein